MIDVSWTLPEQQTAFRVWYNKLTTQLKQDHDIELDEDDHMQFWAYFESGYSADTMTLIVVEGELE